MLIEDRERLVRVEEGIKAIQSNMVTMNNVLSAHIVEENQEKVSNAKMFERLHSRTGMIAVITGFLGGFAAILVKVWKP